mmetsp:Transcript_5368/g.4556  ORF Transcript_5368/g.4556 Transcript_5368/m.4556 type:complete len:90 (-) Transcript_5368:4530-4799(-)|eukprot:CAMPEP_0114575968 /NCGR_PEP_ID=MMETSP0125-20121206/777_1 /TAXON_ID=485358 ORGANISM="Aristerostoma sp., Strain ATCC 50986" /NCGR_SAMPLE_ID=MMETSP0125 /ASSEMBLY_ACC=CAM_ASM_000245 /LENGTH=89 /DNA_ID=CAMNT_0001764107 /DNA_START=963 /DNA_END=1232 /DNA_ORIENTATION=+
MTETDEEKELNENYKNEVNDIDDVEQDLLESFSQGPNLDNDAPDENQDDIVIEQNEADKNFLDEDTDNKFLEMIEYVFKSLLFSKEDKV